MKLDRKKKFDLVIGGLGVLVLKPVVIFMGWLLKRDHTLRPTGDILVLKLLGGGSLILAYPALHSLKKSLGPGQNLMLVTTPAMVPFAEQMQLFDKIHTVDDSSLIKLIVSVILLIGRIAGRIDTCIDFEIHSRGTAILTLLCGARNRLGFFKDSIYWRIGLYTHLVFYNTYSLSASFYDSLIGLLGVEIESIDDAISAFQKLFIADPTKTISLGFACSGHAPERMLSPTQWAHVIDKMNLDRSLTINLLGGPQDYDLGEQIKQKIESLAGITCHNRSGKMTLRESVICISSSQTFLGIDSGLLHIARLLGKESESFWGPTDPHTRLAPRRHAKDVIHYQKISCSPCVHFASIPPCLGTNRCIDAIFDAKIAALNIGWAVLPENIKSAVEIRR